MRTVRKEDVTKPFLAPRGEIIYEMIGRPQEIGGTTKHSFVHVVIPPNKSSSAHYHIVSEETYYVLKGRARMIVNGQEFALSPGQACLIMPNEFASDADIIHLIKTCKNTNKNFLYITMKLFE